MRVIEAWELADRLGLRIEKVEGRDQWIVRDLATDVRVGHGLTFKSVVALLTRLDKEK